MTMGPSAIGAQPPPEYLDEEWLMMQEDEEGDEPFCNCTTGHSIEETDWNQCDSCGKPIYDEEVDAGETATNEAVRRSNRRCAALSRSVRVDCRVGRQRTHEERINSMSLKYVRHEEIGFVLWPRTDALWHSHVGRLLQQRRDGKIVSAGFVEFGHAKRGGGEVPPHPFMVPAAEANRDNAAYLVTAALRSL